MFSLNIFSSLKRYRTFDKILVEKTTVTVFFIKIKPNRMYMSYIFLNCYLFYSHVLHHGMNAARYTRQRNTEGECIHTFQSTTSYNDNSETRRRRSPRTLCPIREEPRRKICVWCLILHPVGFSRRQQENREMEENKTRRKEKALERGLNEDVLSTTLPNPHHCSVAFRYAVAYIHHFHYSAQNYYYCGPVNGRGIRCLSHQRFEKGYHVFDIVAILSTPHWRRCPHVT